MKQLIGLVFLAIWTVGCDDDDAECRPKQYQGCLCPPNETGMQVCDDGYWTLCSCFQPEPDAAVTEDDFTTCLDLKDNDGDGLFNCDDHDCDEVCARLSDEARANLPNLP
jgi:hypothetical protein